MSTKSHFREIVKTSRTFSVALSETDTAIFNYFSSLDTPRSLALWLCYANNEHQQLIDFEVNPHNYLERDCFAFRDDYAATHFLSKSDFLKLDFDRKQVAFEKFMKYENLCCQTNNRFGRPLSDPQCTGQNAWLLNATIRKIESILGDFVPEEFVDQANWGPGVTTLLKGQHVSAVNKFHSESGMTQDLYSFSSPWFAMAYPVWNNHLTEINGPQRFSIQTGNVIITVPKNSKTDRVIAIEPGINLWFQKGIGSMIRRRLARKGIDLNSQVRNQQLAKIATLSGHLATVDFSSASDSISREVVRALLPPQWFQLMDIVRSKVGIHDGQPLIWQKFSSMGNGFTFELESLIFFAAASAVCELLEVSSNEVSVFGDDVIIPNDCYELFSSFSAFLGFIVNPSKSFSSSSFRESCGSHYFDGIDCKPIYLKGKLKNVQSIYKLANGVRMLAHRRNNYYGCDARLRDTWRHLFSRVPKSLRFFVSRDIGDCGFIGNFDEATPVRAKGGIEGFLTHALIDSGVSHFFDQTGLLLSRLKVMSIQEYGNNYTLRGRTKTSVKQVLVPWWYNLGGWH